MRSYLLLLAFFLSLNAIAQTASKLVIESIEGPTPWTSLDLNNNPARFQFAIVTDRTGGHRPGVFMEGVNRLNLLQPEFVMSVGDLIEGYTEDLDELNRQWDEFDGFVDELEMPFFYLPGNHDITNMVMADLWNKRFGPSYYHFVYHDVLFLCLNSEDQARGAGRGTISDEQFEYAKKVLADLPDVKWTLVFMHQPLWHQEDTKRWNDLEELLAGRKHTVFTGHEHRYVKSERNNGNYFVLATTGGSSPLRGPELGEFDHVVWVTMTEQGPILANLQLDGIWSEDVVTQEIKDYIVKASDKTPIEISPVFLGNDEEEWEVNIKVTNDEDVPMTVKFAEKFSWDLVGILSEPELKLPPNSVEQVSLTMMPRKDQMERPLTLQAGITYHQDNMADLEIPLSWNIKPVETYTLPLSQSKIKIDGKSNDWEAFDHEWQSADNETSVQFSLKYDQQYLYIGAKVVDEEIISTGKGSAWSQDNIGIGFNAQPLAKSAMSTGRNWYRNEFLLLISPETKDIPSVISPQLPEGTQAKCVVQDQGYFAEMAIPLSYIVEKQGANWKTLRFNMTIDDKDTDKMQRYFWQPNWRGKENVVGSGMFFREMDNLEGQ